MKNWFIPACLAVSVLASCNKDNKTDNSIEAQLAGTWRGSSRTVEQWDGPTLISSNQTLFGDAYHAREQYGKDGSYAYALLDIQADSTYRREDLQGTFKVWNSYIIHTVSDKNRPGIAATTDTASYILEGKKLTIRSERPGTPYQTVVTGEFYKDE